MENLAGFRTRKAAQIAAQYIQHAGGSIEKLKLIKLLYLTERESVATRGRPIIYDEYYSLKDGPICSNTLNGLNHQSDADVWKEYVGIDGNITRFLPKKLTEDDADEISKSDHKVIAAVWEKFGYMTASQIRKWTHDHCPEYSEVVSGRVPIKDEDMAKAVGVEDPKTFAVVIADYRNLEAAVA